MGRKRKTSKSLYRCKDCNETDFDLFMVKKKIWEKIWPNYVQEMKAIKDPKKRHGVLCQPCAEKRLGRKLVDKDFELNARFWIDPSGISETFSGPPVLNTHVQEILDQAPDDVGTRAYDRYFLLRPASKTDQADMKALIKLGLPEKAAKILYHKN